MSNWQLIEAVAADLGVTANTRRMWRLRGAVSHRMRVKILVGARERGVDLADSDFEYRPPRAAKRARAKGG